MMFRKILIANRGEIAVRVAQTVQQMGIRAAAIYSEPDRGAPHVACADEAYPLEGKTSAETYLRGDRIIALARAHGVDAIHPGYGFLSENAAFAQACADSGLTFIGPSPAVIRAMGDKILAKNAFADAGVPIVPGWSGGADDGPDVIARAAADVSYPVLIKAAAGGGGKGMRVVRSEKDLSEALDAARREAGAAFGDSRVFVEKFIERPRHVEFQIFGDHHGQVVHLFERECSIQRRHQKVIEESPAPRFPEDLRRRMGEAAVRACRAIGYANAGTVEFMVDDAGNFYFLEVNTRLQVEHPVTESVVHHDLVRAQILVASGEKLPFTQDELRQQGHAIEVRVYAEDAARGFLPSTGTLHRYVPPVGPGIRVDSGVAQGREISTFYDPMLAKMIVWGRTRDHAIARLCWALDHFVVLGVTTNIEFLRNLAAHPEFRAGRLDTQFLERHRVAAVIERAAPDEALIAAALASRRRSADRRGATQGASVTSGLSVNPWHSGSAWRVG